MTDKIQEIRARQKDGAPGQMPIAALCQCDADREFLLAEVDRLTRKRDEARTEVERMKVQIERLWERLLRERAALVLDEIGAALERERLLRAALTDMLNGWRYIRETYGDLAGVGWDRAEQKALSALEAKP